MKEEATLHLSSHAFRCPSIMACGWYAFKEELLIPESQFAHKIGKIGVVVESLVYLLTYAFMYFHSPSHARQYPRARGQDWTPWHCAWGLIFCGCHIELFNNFVFGSVFCKYSPMWQWEEAQNPSMPPCLPETGSQAPILLNSNPDRGLGTDTGWSELDVCALHPMTSSVGSGCLWRSELSLWSKHGIR